MNNPLPRTARKHAAVALALAAATLGLGCESDSKTQTAQRTSLDERYDTRFETIDEREPVTAPIAFEETTTPTTTVETTEVFVEEREPTVLTIGEPATAPVATAPPPAPAPSAASVHVVAKGDTLWALAKRYYGSGTRWTEIRDANPGVNPQRLIVGTELVIP